MHISIHKCAHIFFSRLFLCLCVRVCICSARASTISAGHFTFSLFSLFVNFCQNDKVCVYLACIHVLPQREPYVLRRCLLHHMTFFLSFFSVDRQCYP